MTHFVLVPGAWLGSWAWDQVVPLLTEAGHEVTAVTLSGVAERRDIPVGEIGLATHVADVVEAARRTDSEVVLVGHSYSGIPVGQAATGLAERLRRVVFVDSNVPTEPFAGPPEKQEAFRAGLEENGGYWMPIGAGDLAGQDLTDEQIATMLERSTPHPGRTLTEAPTLSAPLAGLPATYIKCLMDWPEPSDDVKELLDSPSWELVELNTGHWPMFSTPDDLAKILLGVA